MSCNVFPHVYEQLIKEDIDWLLEATKGCENSLERSHIIDVLNHSAKEYREHGYDYAMNKGRESIVTPHDPIKTDKQD